MVSHKHTISETLAIAIIISLCQSQINKAIKEATKEVASMDEIDAAVQVVQVDLQKSQP